MLRRCAGIQIPLFSLRSKKCLGTGEFLDLIPLIDWCKEAGFKLINLFPVHDTSLTDKERDGTAFSLHPNYLNIHQLGPEFDDEIRPIAKVLNLPHLEYRRTYLAKQELLRLLFILRKEEDFASKAFEQFCNKNETYLKAYVAFIHLKEKYETPNFHKWGHHSEYSEQLVEEICEQNQAKLDLYLFIQFHCHQQLKKVVNYAAGEGIRLTVDFPLKIHPHSVEAWTQVNQEARSQWLEQYFEILPQMPIVCEREGTEERIFEDPRNFPQNSICIPSIPHMLPLRAWWEENQEKTAIYYKTILKNERDPPRELTEKLAREIIQGYLNSKSNIALFILPDLLAMNDDLKTPSPEKDLLHWRSPIFIEELLLVPSFSQEIRQMIESSKRLH
ncbi:MAG: 4-alpha-glucanotransferase [Verrucomicrobia bacterium]|nr:4-alpha-glucanotransferase [Verrucomicrobiota bacterium]